jgi:hypothetical protein
VRIVWSVVIFIGLMLSARAQTLSDQQLDFLRQQFVEALTASADGAVLRPGTLPPDRLSSPVPSALLDEADPEATPRANAAQSTADTARSEAATAQSTANTARSEAAAAQSSATAAATVGASAQAGVTALSPRVASLEAKRPVWDSVSDFWSASPAFRAGITTNVSFSTGPQTLVLTIVDGLIVGVTVNQPVVVGP